MNLSGSTSFSQYWTRYSLVGLLHGGKLADRPEKEQQSKEHFKQMELK